MSRKGPYYVGKVDLGIRCSLPSKWVSMTFDAIDARNLFQSVKGPNFCIGSHNNVIRMAAYEYKRSIIPEPIGADN